MSKQLLAKLNAAIETLRETIDTARETQESAVDAARKTRDAARNVEGIREVREELERLAASMKRPSWLSSTELAVELGVHEETVRQMYHRGRIRGHRLSEGGHIRCDPVEVQEDLKNGDERSR